MICDLLALRPISHITKKTLSYLHSTKIEQMTKTMVIFKRGAIFLCCIRCDPIPPQTSVQRLAHTRNVTTCCWLPYLLIELFYISMPGRAYSHVITKIYRMVRSPHFLRYRTTLARSRGALLQTSNRSCHPWSCIFVPFFP